ncbi:MAG: NUDIX hydrolase [candidate division WOR-3 bacterium]
MKVIKRELKYEGIIFEIWRETYISKNLQLQREIVKFPETCAVLPITNDSKAILITQFRPPVKKEILEIPAGKIDFGEKPEEAAVRELQEEIKMRPNKLVKLGSFYLTPGYSTEKIHLFLGLDLEESSLPHDIGEDIKIIELPLEDLKMMLYRGEVEDAKTALALFYFFNYYDKCKR